ncbi:DUF1573 domain-containing protein [Candidatus Peregrinibacteria bacterium]|jgi:hypothetical protein|nr:DUF1573 domain-containing protein [Candidatus Peregrinibacteria bacterium]
MKNFKIFLLSLLVGIFGACSNQSSNSLSEQPYKSSGSISVEKNNIDLGEIPIFDGKVFAYFQLKNKSSEAVTLLQGQTSCMCTEAIIKGPHGEESPVIQMAGHGSSGRIDQTIQPGESVTVKAIFDPLAHGPNALGEISRDVYISTNSESMPELRLSFLGNVVKEKPQQASIIFEEVSYDFGLIKQSAGKVKYDFPFVYQGEETLEITGVPTSCACTSAEVNKTSFISGEEGILTVTFNPNLHAEPEGKFFKTISLLTEPKIEELPELKIWAEIDLDLGEGAFELKSAHID